MGLDMYLNKIKRDVKFSPSMPTKWNEEGVEIGYWRKFNALHNYIVNEFNGGTDDCSEIPLSEQDLEQLLDVLTKVSKDHSLAPTLLPTQSGFFFDSLEYDEWYFKRVDYSIEVFTEALEFLKGKDSVSRENEDGTIEYTDYKISYEASW